MNSPFAALVRKGWLRTYKQVSAEMIGRIKGFFRNAAELGKFKRLIAELGRPLTPDRAVAELLSSNRRSSAEVIEEFAALMAPRKAIAAVLEQHGFVGPSGKAKLIDLYADLMRAGAGQWIGRIYVPAVALYDPDLLAILLTAEANNKAKRANRRDVVEDMGLKALAYCEGGARRAAPHSEAASRPLNHTAYLIRQALKAPEACEACVDADSHLIAHFHRNRFNTARAQQIYTIVIDNAVWRFCEGMPNRRDLYRDYLRSDLRHKHARVLVAKLTDNGRRADQRPPRPYLKWLLGS